MQRGGSDLNASKHRYPIAFCSQVGHLALLIHMQHRRNRDARLQTMQPPFRTNDIVTSLCDDFCNLR
jgi:hypothetical protein